MLNNATIDKLITMKLKVMADAYILQEQDPSYRDIEFSDRLAMLVDAQYNQRQDNRMKRLVKTAALDQPEASVMNIDYHSGRNLNRRMIQKLATCEYIVDSLNIFITGATGSGKTYLACALAMEALKQYITVKYVRLSDFLLECTVAWDEKRYDKVLQTYAKPKLLIIDEWLAMTPEANDLHAIKELIHRRRRKSSTIFCSQVLKEGWYQALGGANTEAEAILDRITYDGYDINIEYTDPTKAVSMRKIYNRFYKSIETVNIGGLPFLPSATSLVTNLLEELVSDSPESAFERASLPAGIEERLKSVDWDKREVLIGFVPDEMHRKLFLNNKMYFTRRFDTANLPVRYVALYEKGTGIGWYGEVIGWEKALRKTLPGRSAHGKEKYHVFRVLKWHAFDKPISVSEYGPNPIAYTNYFLLSNSSTYSELLLKSEADYRFFTELKRRTDEAVIEQSDEATAFEFGSAKVLFDRLNICVFVGDKQVDMCTVQEFSKHPNATFRRLQKYAELVIRPF